MGKISNEIIEQVHQKLIDAADLYEASLAALDRQDLTEEERQAWEAAQATSLTEANAMLDWQRAHGVSYETLPDGSTRVVCLENLLS